MARELPIQNGRLTTDLDADGHRIRNLPGDTYSVPWENVTGKPTFANVATSGSYNDLTDKPTIPPAVMVDEALTNSGNNPVKSSGIWSAIWGALASLPAGFSSLYDWCVRQFAGKLSTSGGIVHGLLESSEPLGQSFTGLGVNGMVGYYGGIRWGVRIGTGDNVDFPVLLNRNGGEIVIPSAVGTLAFLSDIPDISGKADAADLRYRIAEAVRTAKLPTGVTVWYESEEVTDYGISLGGGMSRWELNIADHAACIWDLDGTNGDPYGAEFKDGGGAAFSTPPDLVIFRALADRTVNFIKADDGTASIDIELPAAVTVDAVRYARDLIVDVDNSAGASDLDIELASDEAAYLDAGGARYLVAVADGDDLADLLTVAAGKRARLYFTETAQTATPAGGTEAVPVISLQRLTVVVGGAA